MLSVSTPLSHTVPPPSIFSDCGKNFDLVLHYVSDVGVQSREEKRDKTCMQCYTTITTTHQGISFKTPSMTIIEF